MRVRGGVTVALRVRASCACAYRCSAPRCARVPTTLRMAPFKLQINAIRQKGFGVRPDDTKGLKGPGQTGRDRASSGRTGGHYGVVDSWSIAFPSVLASLLLYLASPCFVLYSAGRGPAVHPIRASPSVSNRGGRLAPLDAAPTGGAAFELELSRTSGDEPIRLTWVDGCVGGAGVSGRGALAVGAGTGTREGWCAPEPSSGPACMLAELGWLLPGIHVAVAAAGGPLRPLARLGFATVALLGAGLTRRLIRETDIGTFFRHMTAVRLDVLAQYAHRARSSLLTLARDRPISVIKRTKL